MTTAQTLIDAAYREGNLIEVGGAPTTAERAEALERLNRIIDQLFGFELGEILEDWQVPPTRTASRGQQNPNDPYGDRTPSDAYPDPLANVRLVTKITTAQTVYLPQYPSDGARIAIADAGSTNTALTLDANGRQIEGAATIAVDPTVVTEREWFYRADQANWVRRADLALGDNSPFPTKFDDLLITALFARIAPRYGVSVSAETAALLASQKTKFESYYKQQVPTFGTWRIDNLMSRTQGYGGGVGEFLSG